MTATCPHCDDELDIPAEFAGRPVRCGNCQAVFTPSAPFAVSTPSSADAPQSPLWTDTADRPRPKTRHVVEDDAPTPRTSNAGVWGLGILTVLVMAPCTAGCVWAIIVFGFPRFEPVTDETGRFQAVFPGQPVPVNRKDDEGQLVRGFDLHRDFPPESYFVYYLDPSKGAKKEPEAFLDEAAKRLDEFVPQGSEEVKREVTTHDGYPALDVLLHNDDTQAGTVIVRLVLGKSAIGSRRLYIAGVAGPLQPHDTRAKRFFNGFKLTGK